MKNLLFSIAALMFAPFLSFSQCTTTNATGCSCLQAGSTNCDLLPDIIVGKPPLLATGNYGNIEYAQTGNGSNNGKLRISVSSPNVGHGPLEVRTTTTYICGTDTFTGTAPSICPDGITYPKQLINQRVYHKNGNAMTYYDRPAGTMTYHPTHGHMHVDDWGKYSLRTATSNPNPLTWPIAATGAKLAFCLMDYGTCSYYNGHCVDTNGNILTNSNFPNYGLGGGGYNCSPVVQGISSGYTDIYYQYLDGMWINLPAGLCNGAYYIVIQLDPYNYFLESNENNNVIAVPFTLTKQTTSPTITSSANATLCEGNSTTLTAAGATTYSWLPATGLNATTGSSVIANPGSSTIYTVTGTNTAGCTKTKTVTVTINTKPVLVLTSASAICAGQSVPLQVSGASTYTWSPATGLSATSGSAVNASPSGTTTYTVTATGSNGCTSTASVLVTVNTYPTVNASGNTSICAGSFANLSATGALSFTWMPATGLNATTGGNVIASPVTTTTYTVTGTSNGCSDTKTVTVSINAVPVLTLSPSTDVCSGQAANLQAGGAFSYFWQPATGLNLTTGPSVSANPSNTTTYTVTGTDANGCTKTGVILLNVNQTPMVSASGNVAYCPGGSSQLQASGANDFTWQPATGLDFTTGASVNANPSSTTAYTVTGNSNGCTDSNVVLVTVYTNPVVSLSGLDTAYLDNDSDVTLTGNPAGGTFTGTGITGNVFSPASAGVGGPYVIEYAYTDSNGCSASAIATVAVNQHVTNCGVPTQYSATNISPFNATVNWSPDVSALQFKVRYRKVGTITYKYKTVSGVPNVVSALLNNLMPNTTYECWIKCYCVTPTSFSNKIEFTTGNYPYSCTIPFGLNATNITTTSALVSWDASVSGDSVQMRYTKATGPVSYKYKKSNTNTSFFNLNSLQVGTAYNWSVRVYCNGASTVFSPSASFTTQTIRLGNEQVADETRISAYPNPAQGKVHVVFTSITETTGRLRLADITGRQVIEQPLKIISGDNLVELNLDNLNKGIYMLSVESDGNIRYLKLSIN